VGQAPRELTPERSALDALGAQLRRLRTARGLSQAQLGALILHSGALVGKVEKAQRFPTLEFCRRADEVLESGGLLQRLRPDVDPRARGGGYRCVREPVWSPAVTAEALRELTGEQVDRRGFLALTGSALVTTAAMWARTGPGIPAKSGAASGLTGTSLERLAARLADLRALDDELGGTAVLELARAELGWLSAQAARVETSDVDQCALWGLVAEAARLCGWAMLDAGLSAAAQAHYVLALRCTADVGDGLAGANVLAGMSFQAMLDGQVADALNLLDVAEQRAGRGGSPRLSALLATRRARAHARGGDARACGLALHGAEQALDQAGDGSDEPSWIYFFDAAELAAQSGACWVDLGRPGNARPVLDAALAGLAPQYVRDRSIYLVRSAQAHLHSGELPAACDELTRAVNLVGQTGSVRSIATIRQARHAMRVYDGHDSVRRFDLRFREVVHDAA
jgi:transcriptional regulator with XRE-family HTH domain